MISTFRTSDFQISGSAISSHKNIHGAVRIFLNTRGTDREGISGELAELLEYIEHTNEKRRVKSPRIEKLKNNVEKIKQSGEVSVRYMQAWEGRKLR